MSRDNYIKLLNSEIKPVKIGNKNKTGECGMCGTRVEKLHPQKAGQVDFMICDRCKSIMDM
jgi:transcription elongation factor Elf1